MEKYSDVLAAVISFIHVNVCNRTKIPLIAKPPASAPYGIGRFS